MVVARKLRRKFKNCYDCSN